MFCSIQVHDSYQSKTNYKNIKSDREIDWNWQCGNRWPLKSTMYLPLSQHLSLATYIHQHLAYHWSRKDSCTLMYAVAILCGKLLKYHLTWTVQIHPHNFPFNENKWIPLFLTQVWFCMVFVGARWSALLTSQKMKIWDVLAAATSHKAINCNLKVAA